MGKDRSKDYATAAFRDYAFFGKISQEALEKKFYDAEYQKTLSEELAKAFLSQKKPLLDDIGAVHETVEQLRKDAPDILHALEEVYFLYPTVPLRRNDIVMRIRFFALNEGVSERSVYFWLKKARHLFAEKRGLQV